MALSKIKKIYGVILFYLLFSKASFAMALTNPAQGLFVDFGDNSFAGLLRFFIKDVLLPVVGSVTILFIIYGGFQYITSAGNEEQADAGKKTLTNAIIGLVIIILSYVIVNVINNALSNAA